VKFLRSDEKAYMKSLQKSVAVLKWLLMHTVCVCVANNRLLHVDTENRCGKSETPEMFV
jgi:hypothetical protein